MKEIDNRLNEEISYINSLINDVYTKNLVKESESDLFVVYNLDRLNQEDVDQYFRIYESIITFYLNQNYKISKTENSLIISWTNGTEMPKPKFSTERIWNNLIKEAGPDGIPSAESIRNAQKDTKQFQERKERLLDYYYRKIEESFKEGQFGAMIKLAESGCLIDKETIQEAHNQLKLKGFRIIEIDNLKEKYMIRWD